MKTRLKKLAEKGYNDFDNKEERDAFVKENKDILKNNGWEESGGIGFYAKEGLPVYIDNNSGMYNVILLKGGYDPEKFCDTAKEAINWINKNEAKLKKQHEEAQSEDQMVEAEFKKLSDAGWKKQDDCYVKNINGEAGIFYSQHGVFQLYWMYDKKFYYDKDYPKTAKTVDELLTWIKDNSDYFSEENRKKLENK